MYASTFIIYAMILSFEISLLFINFAMGRNLSSFAELYSENILKIKLIFLLDFNLGQICY